MAINSNKAFAPCVHPINLTTASDQLEIPGVMFIICAIFLAEASTLTWDNAECTYIAHIARQNPLACRNSLLFVYIDESHNDRGLLGSSYSQDLIKSLYYSHGVRRGCFLVALRKSSPITHVVKGLSV